MIEEITAKEFIPLMSAGLGALISLCGVVVANIFAGRNQKRASETQVSIKDRELRLQKLEELYFLFDRWQTNYTITYLNHLRFYVGKLLYTQLLELEIERNKPKMEAGEYQKVQMLLNVYFPNLAKEYLKVDKCKREITPYLQSVPNPVDIKSFKLKQVAFEKSEAEFKKKIAAEVSSIWT